MKILIVSGHVSGYNYSKNTGYNEGDLNIELAQLVKPQLDAFADVTLYPVERNMYTDNKNGKLAVNLSDYDYIFEIHFNAFDGSAYGTSIYLHSDYMGGISVEQAIIENMRSIGFRIRGNNGINRKSTLLNMNTAYKLGIDYALIETCFYDNKNDMELYQKNKNAVAFAIADGIIDKFGLTIKNEPEDEPIPDEIEQPLYCVQISANTNREYAEINARELTDLGYDAFIKFYPEDGLYRVQAGAFVNYDNAVALKNKLINDNFSVYIRRE